MINFSQILEFVKSSFEEELSPTAYSMWIAPLKLTKFNKHEIMLEASNDFYRDIVSSKYSDKFCEKFKRFLGFPINIKFTSAEQPDEQLDNLKLTDDYETEDLYDNVDDYSNINNYNYDFNNNAQHFNNNNNSYNNNNNYNNDNDNFQINSTSNENQQPINSKLDDRYTFKNFIVGNNNSFAYAACKAVAQNPNPSEVYNPLFIYGPSGLGKTHLLRAIENEVKINKPKLNVMYIYCEAFTNEFITALANKTTRNFHDKYRNNVDYLLIDDIQFLAGKIQTQEEFFHTFNELHKNGKQIVLTSDRPPKEIKTLEERLRTRFDWGLLADISPSEFETRVAIIERKSEILGISIPVEIVNYVAENLKNNVRQLEGAVKKFKAYKLLENSSPTISMAKSIIQDILNNNKPTPMTISQIVSEVSKTFNVSEKDIKGNSRQAKIAKARHIAIYIVKEITNAPYDVIGKEFSNRNHSTIIHSLRQVKDILEKEPEQKEVVEDIIQNIRAR